MIDVTTLVPDQSRIQAEIDQLATYADPDAPGWSRPVYSEPYAAERPAIFALMHEAGLNPRMDAVGNIIGVLPGRNPALKPLMTGSHTDTVPGGGRYDGIVGVIGAIEVARILRESGAQLERDLIIVDFLGEEANDFGVSCMGSRALAGTLSGEHLDRTDGSGLRLGDAMTRFGADPNKSLQLAMAPGSLHGYVELHIEQGPLLERANTQIGVVTAIAGIERVIATFAGTGDHSGTTPMADRHDALVAAAEAVLAVERVGCGAPIHGVTTTGRIETWPGALNVVPEAAKLWIELRSVDESWLSGARREVLDEIAELAANRGVHTLFDTLNDQEPVPASQLVQDRIGEAADRLGLSWQAVPSGAGHDAAHLAELGPMGMVFVPSQNGKSHVPEEFTATADIAAGIHVLAATLIDMDSRDTQENA